MTCGSLALLLLCATIGCTDIRSFEGNWQGEIVAEIAVRQGFADNVRVDPLTITDITLNTVEAILTTNDGRFSETPLRQMTKASSDLLGNLTFDGDPLRNYFTLCANRRIFTGCNWDLNFEHLPR